MSRRPRNNHYHYAEQYSDGHYRRKVKAATVVHLPRRAVFFAVLVLLVFGFITATFSANTPTEEAESGSILISVRNAKADRDLVLTGAKSEDDLAVTGANVDYAPTAAQTYYYIGQGNGDGWVNSIAMTVSDDGFYEYYQITSTTTHQFKIGTSSDAYAYNYTYVHAGFNSTNVSEIGDYGSDNCYCWKGSTHYIIVYYPNTIINTTNKPKICASTTLPDNSMQVSLGEFFTNASQATEHSMTLSSGTWTYSQELTGNLTRGIYFHVNWKNHSGDDEYYKDLNLATMTYDHCTNWTFRQRSGTDNPKLQTVITGSYSFSFQYAFQYTNNKPDCLVSVTYPSYTVTTSVSADHGTTTNTATNTTNNTNTVTVAIGSSVEVSATTTDTSYNFGYWSVTGNGAAKTGSYTGTVLDINNNNKGNNPLTIYPCGTSQTVNLQANYAIKQYPITYKMDATPATAATGTITNPATDSVPIAGEAQQHDSSYTITSNKYVRPGYTQKGWATTPNRTNTTGTGYYGFGASYSGNAALTLYPVWELNAPANPRPAYYHNLDPDDEDYTHPKIVEPVSGDLMTVNSMVVGGTVSLGLDIDGGSGSTYQNNGNITRSYGYHIEGPDIGNNQVDASVGTDPTDPDNFMMFTSGTPGTYTVYITVTDVSSTGVINPVNAQNKGYATANTNTVTITVLPDAPIFDILVSGIVDDPERDGSSGQGKAYMVMLGNRYYFSAAIDSTYLQSHSTSLYKYEWSTDPSFDSDHKIDTDINNDGVQDNLTTITFKEVIKTDPDTGDPITDPDTGDPITEYRLINYDSSHTYDPTANPPDPDPRMLAEESDGNYHSVSLYCRVTRNSVYNNSILKQKWYFIQPLIKSFNYEPMQKIFNLNDQTVSLAAKYNVTNDPDHPYQTKLYFSSDNSNDVDDWTVADTADSGFIESFTTAIQTYLFPSGPKFFYLLLKGYNSQGELIESRSEKIHTTVDTTSSTANRTLYINNTTELSLKNYLVMCYYTDVNGDLKYQVAQDMHTDDDDEEDETTFNNNGFNYRVMIPSNTRAVTLGFLSNDVEGLHYYGTPTVLPNGTINGFTGPTYYGYSQTYFPNEAMRVINLSHHRTETLEYFYS